MNDKAPETPFDIKDFRQPVVTSVGVLLGFLIGFLGQWVTETGFALRSIGDGLVFAGALIGFVLLLITLFRMLWPGIPPARALNAYRRTLTLYICGLIIAFGAMALSALVP